jgi:hypothetical protein
VDLCKTDDPALLERTGGGHLSACHFAGKLDLAATPA